MMETGSIRVERREGLAVVSLARAARGNPIEGDFGRDFLAVFSALSDEPDLRAVLLRADGPNFSVGGDLKTFFPLRDRLGPLVREWTSTFHMGLQRAWRLPVPIVCAVQGYAMGGSLGVVGGCDVVVAGEGARFGSAFAQIGFSNDSGTTAALVARMGAARARRFVLLAEMLTSAEALAAGLVDRVVADDRVQDEALAVATRLAAGPTRAYAEIKRLFRRAAGEHLEALLEDEAHALARTAGTADAQEGVAAMVEKRTPAFRGR